VESPETVTDAVRLLEAKGYDTNFKLERVRPDEVSSEHRHPTRELVVLETFRFEGPTDPGDEAIVLGVECPVCHARGIVVSAYGPDADPELLALLEHLAR
jgi:hypothetical protein